MFTEFRRMYALSQLWPVPIAELQCFITYLYHKGYASKTVGTYMAAISFQHKLNGIADPAADFTVTKMLEGIGAYGQPVIRVHQYLMTY